MADFFMSDNAHEPAGPTLFLLPRAGGPCRWPTGEPASAPSRYIGATPNASAWLSWRAIPIEVVW